MPLVSATASNPTKFDTMSFVIDWNQPNPIHLTCTLRSWNHSVSQNFGDVKTLCNPNGEAPTTAVEELQLEHLWEHSTTGAWNLLRPLVGLRRSFAALLHGTGATSAANPEMSGFVWIPQIPFLTATEVGGYSYVPLTYKVSGIPVYDTDGVPVYAGHIAPS